MEIQRKAYSTLLDWKNSSDSSKAIIIKGARRVGKSYLAEAFARREYKSYILIDFSSPMPGTMNIFRKYGNKAMVDEFLNQLSVLYGTTLYPGNSCIIFDEIQFAPKAREFIKHLVANGKYDYIETGSLISIKKNASGILIPSEEDEMFMHPLTFEEFLHFLGKDVIYDAISDAYVHRKPLGNLLKPANEMLRLYMIVGGMPQPVLKYAESQNYDTVEKEKRRIIKLYREDIAKYAESYVAEASAIFNMIPSQLSHHDKKIKFSALIRGKRADDFSDALFWIGDSMVGNLCYALEQPEHFDGFYIDSSRLKCYMADTGLLLTLAAGESKYLSSSLYKSFVSGKLSVNKGMMTENYVSSVIRANGHPLRFYETYAEANGNNKKYEIDFLIRKDNRTIPIEVKSGNTSVHSSIDFFRKKYGRSTSKGIILTKGDYRETDEYIYVPLVMADFVM